MALREIISGAQRGHQWRSERSSVGLREVISGAQRGHQWRSERSSVALREVISGAHLQPYPFILAKKLSFGSPEPIAPHLLLHQILRLLEPSHQSR